MANELVVSLKIGASLSSGFLATFSGASKTLNQLSEQSKTLNRHHERMGSLLSLAIARPNANLSRMKQHYDQIGNAIRQSELAQFKLNKAIEKGQVTSQKRQEAQGKLLEATGLGIATYGIATTVMKSYISSEDAAMSLKVSMMKADKTFGQFEEISKIANSLGTELPGTTKDFYELATALKMQGISDKVLINGALQTSAKLNVLLGMDQQTGGEFLAKYMEAHGLGEAELGKAADALQRAMFASGLSKDQMFEAMKYYAPKVSAMGLKGAENTEKILAIEGIAGAQGLEGSSFGTSFNNFLSELSGGVTSVMTAKTGDKSRARKMLEKSGVSLDFYDEKGNFKGINAMMTELEKLEKVKENFGAEGLTTVTEAIWGKEGGRLADILVEKGSAGLEQQLAKMREQASLQDRIKQKTSTLGSALESLGGVWDNLVGTIGSAFADDIKSFAESAQSFIETTLQPFLENNKSLIKSVGGLVLGLMAGRVAFIGLRYVGLSIFSLFNTGSIVVQTLIAKYRLLATVMRLGLPVRGILNVVNTLRGLNILARLGTVFNVLKNGALIAGRAMLFLGRALLMNPIGLAITAIAVGAYLIYRYWQPIKGFFIGVWQSIKTAFAPVGAFFSGLAQGLMTGLAPLKPLVMGVVNLFVSAWGGLKNIVGTIFEGVVTVISLIGSRIVDIASGFVDLLGVAWQGLITILQPVIDLFGRAFDGIATAFSGLWQSVQNFIQPIITAISEFFNITEAGSRNTGEMIGLVLGGAITGLVNIFSSSISAIVSLFSGGISNLISTILSFSPVSLFSQILSGLSPYISMVWESIKALFSGGISNLSATILSFSPVSLFAQVFATVGAFFSGLVGNFSEYGRNLMQGLINGITSMIGAVTAKISGLASQVKSAFTTPTQIHSPSRVFMGYGQNLMQGLAIGIDKTSDLAIQGTRQVGVGLLNQIPSQLPTPTFMPTENMGWKGLAQQAIRKIPMLQPVLNIAKQAQSLFLDEPTGQGFTRLQRPVEQYSSTQHGAITVHFNPTIQVNVQNPDVQQQVQQGLQMSMYEFEIMFNRLMEQQKRRAF